MDGLGTLTPKLLAPRIYTPDFGLPGGYRLVAMPRNGSRRETVVLHPGTLQSPEQTHFSIAKLRRVYGACRVASVRTWHKAEEFGSAATSAAIQGYNRPA
jgi:hypothetical protein